MDRSKNPSSSRRRQLSQVASRPNPGDRISSSSPSSHPSAAARQTLEGAAPEESCPGSHVPAASRYATLPRGPDLPYRERDQSGSYDVQATQPPASTTSSSPSPSTYTPTRALTQADALTRVLTPMSSSDFGGNVRDDFSDDPEYMSAQGREHHRRDLARWLKAQGSFHGRPSQRRRRSVEEGAAGTAGGPAEPRTPDGLEPGVGPQGQMEGDEWRGHGREPALGPLDAAEAEKYERELRAGSSGRDKGD